MAHDYDSASGPRLSGYVSLSSHLFVSVCSGFDFPAIYCSDIAFQRKDMYIESRGQTSQFVHCIGCSDSWTSSCATPFAAGPSASYWQGYLSTHQPFHEPSSFAIPPIQLNPLYTLMYVLQAQKDSRPYRALERLTRCFDSAKVQAGYQGTNSSSLVVHRSFTMRHRAWAQLSVLPLLIRYDCYGA